MVLLLLVSLSVFWVWTGFLALPAARRLYEASKEIMWIPDEALVIALVLVVAAYLSDIVYNTIIGTIRFKEAPKWLSGEFLYSHRIQRLVNHRDPSDWRYNKALTWARVLNIVDPGHIDIPT